MDAPVEFLAARRQEALTFKANLKDTRYGWIRLTPAYSVHLVRALLAAHARPAQVVLDPFCGTGTTALVCAEQGRSCDTIDINPFLVWLARAKTRSYTDSDLARAEQLAVRVADSIVSTSGQAWIPPIHQVEKWWSPATLQALGRAAVRLRSDRDPGSPAADLLDVAFCRTIIDHAQVSFGHQSMSFRKAAAPASGRHPGRESARVAESWSSHASQVIRSAASRLSGCARVMLCDARRLDRDLPAHRYGCVVTSPPYPNRMSYVRELRPYMYWMGYLVAPRDAGELDWKAMGGTWGCATSNVGKWRPDPALVVPAHGLDRIVDRIAQRSPLLSRYVHKYFQDFLLHARALFRVVAPGGTVHYVVGNSKFYDVVVPVEQLIGEIFSNCGFDRIGVEAIRKRSSKKELFEFVVHGRKPPSRPR